MWRERWTGRWGCCEHEISASGYAASGPYRTVITPKSAGWGYSGLRILQLAPGQEHVFGTGDAEHLVLPLSGGCTVTVDGASYELKGRDGVFGAPTDFLYLPRDGEARVTSRNGGRFALPSARCERRLPVRYGPAEEVPVELRGAAAAAGRSTTTACRRPSTPTGCWCARC